jgi:prefoldin subunit 5
MVSSVGVPDDERKGRRLGDETKGRIADLASGWTVDGDAPPAPELPLKREASGPTRVARDAPRRKAKTLPPPAPGSAARKALEDKIIELTDALEEQSDPPARPAPTPTPRPTPTPFARTPGPLPSPLSAQPAGPPPLTARPPGPLASVLPARPREPLSSSPPAPAPGRLASSSSPSPGRTPGPPSSPPGPTPRPTPRPRTSQAPLAGKARAIRERDPLDLSTIPEADKTKENRGAVGIRHDSSGGSITTNAASGTIGGDTPPPIFDRAAIAAGQKGAIASERIHDRLPHGTAGGSGPTGTAPSTGDSLGASGPNAAARGTPKPFADKPSLRPDPSPGRRDPSSPAPPQAPVIVDDSLQATYPEPSPDGPQLAVPVGEFDHGQTILEQDKLRVAYTQATIQRDAASALLGLAEPALTVVRPPAVEVFLEETAMHVRGDATFNDASGSSTGRFDRGDPTLGDERGDATALSPPAFGHASAGTLRSLAALRRKRGIAGDVRYVATVVFGVRAIKRELAVLAARQATRQQSLRHHLVTLGRTAATSAGADHPALGPAREQLSGVEDERSQHAGHVIAADAELTRVRRDREAKATQYVVDLAALETEIASLARKLEPLDKDAGVIKKRAADLRDAMRRIDGKIAATEASLLSVKADKLDRAQVQAEIATLKADRKAIQRDEPAIAGELDALNPRIAALEAARGEAQRKRAELETSEQEDQRRVEELLAAIGAKRKVVDRAAADAEALRDKILFQLGERLYVDRPADLTGQLAPIDEIDVELGIADRRVMELREIISSIDKPKVARGVVLMLALLGALVGLVGWLIYLLR